MDELYELIVYYVNISFQIRFFRDFEYWNIFSGLTPEEIKMRQESFDYPPRLQIECQQIDPSKSLYNKFDLYKRYPNQVIAEFSLVKKVTGKRSYFHNVVYSSV